MSETVTDAIGTYTPIAEEIINAPGITVYPADWELEDGWIKVKGRLDLDPLTANFACIFLSLPKDSNMTKYEHLIGSAHALNTANVGVMYADYGNTPKHAVLTFFPSSTSIQIWLYEYSYKVIA